jgi:hypothetical protein
VESEGVRRQPDRRIGPRISRNGKQGNKKASRRTKSQQGTQRIESRISAPTNGIPERGDHCGITGADGGKESKGCKGTRIRRKIGGDDDDG